VVSCLVYGFQNFIYSYVYWYEARFSYQMRFVLFKSDVTGVISKICSSNSLEAPDHDTSLVFSGF
jgi:hypothetical protein